VPGRRPGHPNERGRPILSSNSATGVVIQPTRFQIQPRLEQQPCSHGRVEQLDSSIADTPDVARDHRFVQSSAMLGVKMNAAIALILALLLSGPAMAAETAAMFAKGIIEPGLHPWAIVTVPDECLVVELRLDPLVAKHSDLKKEFGAIARTVVPAALDKFPKLKSVQLTGLVTVRDKRSNDHDVQAVMVKFYRANSASIKWDTVNPADVIDLSDKKAVSPTLAATVAH
jgi:hypothetical protein